MDYSSMTLAELREVARNKEVKSITTLKKAELIQVLQKMEEEAKKPEAVKKPEAAKKLAEKESKELQGASEEKAMPTRKKRTETVKAVSLQEREGKEAKTARSVKGMREARDTKELRDAKDIQEVRDIKEPRDTKEIRETRDIRDTREVRRTMHSEFRSGRGMNKTMRSERQLTNNNEGKQPEIMRYESRTPIRSDNHTEARTSHTEGRGTHTEVREPQSYETEAKAERVTEEKRTVNIRSEAFTKEEFMKQENPEILAMDSGMEANGILEVMDGYGFIRSANYLPGENDVYVAPAQIRRFNLKTGDILKGNTRNKAPSEKFSALLYISTVNGYHPLEAQKRRPFEELTPIFPDEKIKLEQNGSGIPMRIVDVIAPIGKGQRGMIVSPPKAGKTTLLKQMAKTISRNYEDMHMLVLLIDERPEEVTDIRESIEGPNVEVIYSTFDELPEHHKRVAEMVLDRAKRLVEHKKDVVILLDSITRLARAYNLIVPPSGRTLTGGLDPAALYMPKKFFGAARNIREGGSLTILATALVETGSKMDDVVFEEFKGTGNMELVLDRKLSEKRIFPALDISKSGTRRDDLLLTKEEQDAMYLIRREISGAKGEEAIEEVLKLFVRTKDNAEFLQLVQKSLGRR